MSARSSTRDNIYPGEHQAISAAGSVGPGARHSGGKSASARQQEPGAITGAAPRPDLRRRRPGHVAHAYAPAGKALPLLRFSQSVLKGDSADDVIRRVSAAEIETAVIAQVRALLRQPEIVVGTWMAARAELPELTEDETREALERLDPLWDELFPAEQARIIRLLVERVEIGPAGADIRLRIAGLTSLVRDLRAERRCRGGGRMSEMGSITVHVSAGGPATARTEDDSPAIRERAVRPNCGTRRPCHGQGARPRLQVEAYVG